MQATSDKTASANFTQTGFTSSPIRGIANNISNGKTGYNPYFQWGRKDAFRSQEYTDAPGTDNTLVYKTGSTTVGKTIQNPTTMYNDSGNPYLPVYYNAWHAPATTPVTIDIDDVDLREKTDKTVYDPCPVGYAVPAMNAFTAFNATNFTVSGDGRQYTANGKTLYFPYTGFRGHTAGTVDTAYTRGWCFLAVYNSDLGSSWAFDFGETNDSIKHFTPHAACHAFIIRPVREK